MLGAAQKLLVERGSDEFALSDVSRVGRVSIGSIYHRFQSKEELLRAVHQKLMQDLNGEQSAMVAVANETATDLQGLLALLIDQIAEFLKRHASALRPMMACANKDSAIAAAGKASHAALRRLFIEALVRHGADIGHPDPQAAADVCFKMIYAAIARDLGFEAAHIAADASEWNALKANLFAMCTAFLLSPPTVSFANALPRADTTPAPPPGKRGRAARTL